MERATNIYINNKLDSNNIDSNKIDLNNNTNYVSIPTSIDGQQTNDSSENINSPQNSSSNSKKKSKNQTNPKKQSLPSNRKEKPKKFSEEARIFFELFKDYRENILKIPVTHRDWHLKVLAIAEKLLKKYSLEELKEALRELMEEPNFNILFVAYL